MTDMTWQVGSHATVFETTREVLSRRRLLTITETSKQLSQSRNIKDLWTRLLSGIEGADKDVPLALLYSSEVSATSSSEDSTPKNVSAPPDTRVCVLEGTIGVPAGHPIAPVYIDLGSSASYLGPLCMQAADQGQNVVVPLEGLPSSMIAGIEWRGYGVPSTHVVISPIIPTNSGKALGFLLLALNPRLSYDEDYRSFLHMLTGQLTTPQLSAIILGEEVVRVLWGRISL